jgi:hypothetical protein
VREGAAPGGVGIGKRRRGEGREPLRPLHKLEDVLLSVDDAELALGSHAMGDG